MARPPPSSEERPPPFRGMVWGEASPVLRRPRKGLVTGEASPLLSRPRKGSGRGLRGLGRGLPHHPRNGVPRCPSSEEGFGARPPPPLHKTPWRCTGRSAFPLSPPAQRRGVAVGVAGERKGDRLAGGRRSGPIRVNFGATTTAARRAETTAKITLCGRPQGREGQGVTASSKTRVVEGGSLCLLRFWAWWRLGVGKGVVIFCG